MKPCALIHRIFNFVDDVGIGCVLVLPHVVFLVFHVGKVLHVWLQLLEQDQAEGDQCLAVHLTYILSILDRINIKEDVVLFLQNLWVLLHKALYELRQEQDDPAVPIPNRDHLLKQVLVLFFLQSEVASRRLQLLFDLLDARVQIVHQVLLLGVLGLPLRLLLELLVNLADLGLELLDLLLVLLYHFLAEVAALG